MALALVSRALARAPRPAAASVAGLVGSGGGRCDASRARAFSKFLSGTPTPAPAAAALSKPPTRHEVSLTQVCAVLPPTRAHKYALTLSYTHVHILSASATNLRHAPRARTRLTKCVCDQPMPPPFEPFPEHGYMYGFTEVRGVLREAHGCVPITTWGEGGSCSWMVHARCVIWLMR